MRTRVIRPAVKGLSTLLRALRQVVLPALIGLAAHLMSLAARALAQLRLFVRNWLVRPAREALSRLLLAFRRVAIPSLIGPASLIAYLTVRSMTSLSGATGIDRLLNGDSVTTPFGLILLAYVLAAALLVAFDPLFRFMFEFDVWRSCKGLWVRRWREEIGLSLSRVWLRMTMFVAALGAPLIVVVYEAHDERASTGLVAVTALSVAAFSIYAGVRGMVRRQFVRRWEDDPGWGDLSNILLFVFSLSGLSAAFWLLCVLLVGLPAAVQPFTTSMPTAPSVMALYVFDVTLNTVLFDLPTIFGFSVSKVKVNEAHFDAASLVFLYNLLLSLGLIDILVYTIQAVDRRLRGETGHGPGGRSGRGRSIA